MKEDTRPISTQELFQSRRTEVPISEFLDQKDVFPLGQFSQFVLLRQPVLLREIREGKKSVDDLYREQEEQLAAVTPEVIASVLTNSHQAQIALLDTTFARSGITFSSEERREPSKILTELNAALAQVTGLPDTMTFQKVITINSSLPYEAMRTFTDGDVRITERGFYYGHALMNAPLEKATQATQNALVLVRQGEIDGAQKGLEQIAGEMEHFAREMSSYNREMDAGHFKVFRQYLSRYPDFKPNASGAYIGMPRLQLRMTGSSSSYDQFLEKAMDYFSPEDQEDIEKAKKEIAHGSLVDVCEGLPKSQQFIFAQVLHEVLQKLHLFRERHYAAVMKFIPEMKLQEQAKLNIQLQEPEEELQEEIGEEGLGTGGFPGGPLLRNIMRLNQKGMQRLEKLFLENERRQRE